MGISIGLRETRSRRIAAWAVALGVYGVVVTGLPSDPTSPPANISVIHPEVLVRHAGGEYVPARDGEALRAGDAIRTDASGVALVLYLDGSTVTLGPDGEIVIERLEVNSAGRVVALMLQTAGRVWYAITNAISPNSRYEVRTVAAAAVVRSGSVVEVDVDSRGATTVTTVSGEGSIDTTSVTTTTGATATSGSAVTGEARTTTVTVSDTPTTGDSMPEIAETTPVATTPSEATGTASAASPEETADEGEGARQRRDDERGGERRSARGLERGGERALEQDGSCERCRDRQARRGRAPR